MEREREQKTHVWKNLTERKKEKKVKTKKNGSRMWCRHVATIYGENVEKKNVYKKRKKGK